MEFILNIIQRVLFFEKEPQKIGLTQLKESPKIEQTAPSIKSKDIKLSIFPAPFRSCPWI